ncbi:MAG: signal peptidase I [Gemmatimonadetes bacterium]|nr:signal peptidase I [Gemmatimonadota bacterium]MYK65746.1 signal peptidase I [Gemmatimonadota bacterium]
MGRRSRTGRRKESRSEKESPGNTTRSARKKDGKKQDRGTSESRAARSLFEWMKSIALAVGIVLILRLFVFQTFFIDSGSMRNTLLVGDFVFVNRLAMGSPVPFTNVGIPGYGEPGRGEVLVFDPPHDDTLTVIKRLIGMPGDTLEMRGAQLYLNGEPRSEPYAVNDTATDHFDPDMLWQREILLGGPRADYRPTRDNWGPLVIPEGRYFMLGDNRWDSLDSRYWGLLERWRFRGRAVFIYFSYDRGSMRPFPWLTEARWSRIGDGIR